MAKKTSASRAWPAPSSHLRWCPIRGISGLTRSRRPPVSPRKVSPASELTSACTSRSRGTADSSNNRSVTATCEALWARHGLTVPTAGTSARFAARSVDLTASVERNRPVIDESALRSQAGLERPSPYGGGHTEIRVELVREDHAPARRPVPPRTCPTRQERSRVLDPVRLVLVQNATS